MLSTIWFSLLLAIGLYCLSTYIKPVEGERNPRVLLIGILSLMDAAFHLRATYSLIFAHLPHGAVFFRLFSRIVDGMLATMLVSLGFKKGARNMLILAGALLVVPPLGLILALALHRTALAESLHVIFASSNIYNLEAWPIGIAIPAVVLLLRGDGSNNLNAGNDSLEHTSESGNEA
jgi:hypothetical protein